MTFATGFALLFVCLAGAVVVKRVSAAHREALATKDAEALRLKEIAQQEEKIEEAKTQRLKEMEENLALEFAALIDGKPYLFADVVLAEDAPAGYVVTICSKEGERQLVRIYIDLTYYHGEWPLALKLGDNEPRLYHKTDQTTVEGAALETMQYIQAALNPGSIH